MANFTPVGVEAVIKNEQGFAKGLNVMQGAITGFATAAAQAAIQGVAQLGQAVAGLAIDTVRDAIKIESAFAGIVKTADVELTDAMGNLTEAGSELKGEFRELAKEIPISAEELMEIGELGGQLGISLEGGSDALLGFTEAIAAMGVSTNLTTEDAAQQFAQLANIMGTVEEEGDEAFSKLGSTVVDLGNNFATTESDIVNFASRIAGAGQIVGLAESDVLAIGAAMSSVGVQAEAGGTAVQKVLLAMNEAALGSTESIIDNSSAIAKGNNRLVELQTALDIAIQRQAEFTEKTKESTRMASQARIDKLTFQIQEQGQALGGLIDKHGTVSEEGARQLEIFAQTAGWTAERFKDMWEKDAALAFNAFVRGLGEAGDDAIPILEELDLKDQRLTRSLLSLANANIATEEEAGLLSRALMDASVAWDDNNALTKEAGQRYATMESQIQIVKNQIRDFGITIGEALLPFLRDALEIAKPFIQQLGERLPDFLNTFVIPALERFMEFIGTGLPIAIQFLSDLWTNTLQPAIQTVIGFLTGTAGPAFNQIVVWIQENIVPALGVLAEWFQQILPLAIDILRTWWEDKILVLFAALQEQWIRVQPSLQELWSWLQERVPQAIQTLSDFWTSTLQPAIATFWAFVAENIIPILGDIVIWLAENIPVAIDAAAEMWENTLQPALETVWEFIQDRVIPIIEDVIEWLQENIPMAIEEARRVWEEVLLPAITEVWEFIDENIMPILQALWDILVLELQIAVEGLAIIWETVLQPALEGVWKFINEKVMPILRDDLLPILKEVSDFIRDVMAKAFDIFSESLGKVLGFLTEVLTKLREWRSERKGGFPEDFVGESPPPAALWLIDIGAAMADLSQRQIPALQASLATLGGASIGVMASAPATAITNNNSFTFQTTVASDIDAAVFQARTARTVEQTLAAGL